ncbi:MAG: hypothetical protein AAF494_01885 [Pseudomonadota bacterium]
MTKTLLMGAGFLATVALGIGGYSANEMATCQELHEDHLDSIAAVRDRVGLDIVMTRLGRELTTEPPSDMDYRRIELTYSALLDRCGDDAAAEAYREGQLMLAELL